MTCPYYERAMQELATMGPPKPGQGRPAKLTIWGKPGDNFSRIEARFEYHPGGGLKAVDYDVHLKGAIHTTTIQGVLMP